MIFLPLIGNRVLIFEIDDIKKLREVGIVGVLSGTLPKAPQQNVFLGVPLQLSIYEVLWLIDNGHAKLIDSKAYHKMLMEGSTPQQINEGNKVRLAGPSNSHYVITPNTSPNKLDLDMNSFEVSRDEYLMRQPILHENFAKKYNAFSKLRSMGHYLMPGLRFGGTFVSYPGDPLRFHSHLIVKCVKPDEEVNLIDLVTGGRLATAVKKAWVLVSEEPTRDDSIDAYSIEWAGFG
ncbi:tRNA-intron endonuclease [Candidozyma auris]|uniref:tRNA-splicing endonuclease subunit SEN34 n=1 Tax=Candidozyma auris TaxID=498019 RepID=A0A2H0ZRP8_CANAR|nr:tRNA-intron_endonuclease [[Candida] auris]PIS51378.1 tRNA-intron endonuclease [[Candida] auris]PIS53364.1 tRNA-intron endonuclease [[Candida] auris]QEO20002.1 tRNA-intron_endonuclease [[Candida] auris]GBL50018.1 putative tRNA-intron lyase [[Candida] auris]